MTTSHLPKIVVAFLISALSGLCSAMTYNATAAVDGFNGTVLTAPSAPFNNIWFGAGYNTPTYQNLYASFSPAPNGFADSTALSPQAGTTYGKLTFALKGAGTYTFSVMEPGTVRYQAHTAYDLTAAVYANSGTSDPFLPGNLQANLVAFNDDDASTNGNNPYPIYYINNDPSSCITVSLVFFSWGGTLNSIANIQGVGPGVMAADCSAVDQAIAASANAVPTLGEYALMGLVSLVAMAGLWGLRRRPGS